MPKARAMLPQTRESPSPTGDASNGTAHSSPSGAPPAGGPPKKNDKDRPKRKKANRACASCQRAHLTCSNDRPCERCVKRNIAHNCADGVRKKAKYLNDEEAGDSSRQPTQPVSNIRPQSPPPYEVDAPIPQSLNQSNTSPALQISPPESSALFADPNANGWLYGLQPYSQDLGNFSSDYATTEDKAMHQITAAMGHAHGAGVIGTPDNSVTPQNNMNYSPSQGYMPYTGNSNNDILIDVWPTQSRSNSAGGNMGIPHTFTIATGPGSIATPSPPAASPQSGQSQSNSRMYDGLSGSPRTGSGPFYRQPHGTSHGPSSQQLDQSNRQNSLQQHYPQQGHHNHPQHSSHLQPQGHSHSPQATGRRRAPPIDPSHVYTTVKTSYSYVQAYHRLFETIDARFSHAMRLRIARAFSAFRPSFIALAQSLRTPDLLFQEKCCQRAIHLYESSLPSFGTPTIVCRRSGEVVVVGKEFSMLSGWPKEVLLGEKPNLNTNVPNARRDETIAMKRKFLEDKLVNGGVEGSDLPSLEDNDSSAPARPSQPPGSPVFLLELFDDESVCEFYEDFAKVAFADSTGKVTRSCKILKYRPPQPTPAPNSGIEETDDTDTADNDDKQRANGRDSRGLNKRPSKPAKQSTIDILGSSTTISCMVCWTLRRDVFDIPMLIVLNFLPDLLGASSNNANSRESDSKGSRNTAGQSSGSSNKHTSTGNNPNITRVH